MEDAPVQPWNAMGTLSASQNAQNCHNFESFTSVFPIQNKPQEIVTLNGSSYGTWNTITLQGGPTGVQQHTTPFKMNSHVLSPFELRVPRDQFGQPLAVKGASEKYLVSLLAECVKVDPSKPRRQKLPRLHGPLKAYLLNFIDFNCDLGVSKRKAVAQICMRIYCKTGIEIEEKIIAALLDNWKRESRDKFGDFNDLLFEGLELVNFKNIDEDWPLLSK